MELIVKLQELEEHSLRLNGQLAPADLDLDVDELVHLREPLTYDLTVEKVSEAVLVQGKVRAVLTCECARCLKSFALVLEWADWTAHLPLTGEDCVPLIDGAVDLTPSLREDILLGFPQHPLCKSDCGGLAPRQAGQPNEQTGSESESASVWSALNQLKLK